MKRHSILHDMTNCYVCGKRATELHEIYFGTKHRNKSIQHGLVVGLCMECHRGTNGVHGKNGLAINTKLKQDGQKIFNNDIEFYRIFERNYL